MSSPLSRREGWALMFIGCALLIAFTLIWLATPAHAEERLWTTDDVFAAIDEAAVEMGVSYAWLYATVRCETGWTWNPYVRGRQGELGPAQLHPRGELLRFFALGYDDPFSPYQSIRFMAQRFAAGGWRAWSCA